MAVKSSTLDLAQIEISKLTIGEPLPGHLRDRFGRILISKGQLLSDGVIAKVQRNTGSRNFIWVGPDWPVEPEAAETEPETEQAKHKRIISFLQDQNLISNKRRNARYRLKTSLSLGLEEVSGLHVIKRNVVVETFDISLSGIGFTYNQCLLPGTTVYCKFDFVPNSPIVTGTIRRCQKDEGMTHQIGVEFVLDNKG